MMPCLPVQIFVFGRQYDDQSGALDEVGRLNTPVVLCKDKHHRVDDWLVAAEHIALRGNSHIMLGEAGDAQF